MTDKKGLLQTCSIRALLNAGGGGKTGGDATFVWEERAQTCATQMTHMPSLKPLCFSCENQGSLRHWCVICLSQRKNTHPVFRSAPIKSPRYLIKRRTFNCFWWGMQDQCAIETYRSFTAWNRGWRNAWVQACKARITRALSRPKLLQKTLYKKNVLVRKRPTVPNFRCPSFIALFRLHLYLK